MRNRMLRLSLILAMCLLMVGCYDRSTHNDLTVMRDYMDDARIMSKFIDVDESNGELYLNGNKKTTPTDYVLNRSREEYDCVTDINRRTFIKELNVVNNILSTMRGAEGISAIIYNLYNDRYVINIRENLTGKNVNMSTHKYNHILHADITSDQMVPVQFKCNAISGIRIIPDNSGSILYVGQITLKDCLDNTKSHIIIAGINDGTPQLPFSLNLESKRNRTWELSGILFADAGNRCKPIGIDIIE